MPYGNFQGGENFVLGQTSAFGSDIAKAFKKSNRSSRQQALATFMKEQGAREQSLNKGVDRASYLENLKAAPYQRIALGGIHAGAKEPVNGTSIKDMAILAKDYPELMNTMLLAGTIQSPVKLAGWLGEQVTGDPNTGNDVSKSVLDFITAKKNSMPGGMRGYRPEMTRDQKRIANNEFYASQLKGNDERALAKEMLAPEFTSDTSYGDIIDTASWFSPGSVAKGLKIGLKGAREAVLAAKEANFSGKAGKLALGGTAGLGAAAVYGGQPDDANAAWNLAKPASYAGEKMKSIVGKNIDEFTPDDIEMLIKQHPQTILGRSDRAGFDTNYNKQRIIREAFNEMLNRSGETGNKRGYGTWFKSLPKEERDRILQEGRKLSDTEISKLGMDALDKYTTVVNGQRVWKEGGKEAMLGKHDLGHATVGAERGTSKHPLFFQPSKNNLSAAAIFMRK
jgi:hypothetical protein